MDSLELCCLPANAASAWLRRLGCEMETNLKREEAANAPKARAAQLQTELNKLESVKAVEYLRATQLAKATVEAESAAKVLPGLATCMHRLHLWSSSAQVAFCRLAGRMHSHIALSGIDPTCKLALRAVTAVCSAMLSWWMREWNVQSGKG